MKKEILKPRFTLKWGNISYIDNIDIKTESYKAFDELTEREEKLRALNWWWRRENRDLDCFKLCLRAITKAPKNAIFKNDFTDEFYTKAQAIDYITNYWIDY